MAVGEGGNGPGQFSLPAGAHVDKNNQIFIADQVNGRILMFEYIEDTLPEKVEASSPEQ